MMFSLNMVDYFMYFLSLSTCPSYLKVVGGGWVGGIQDFSVSPRPLGFWFLVLGAKGLGPGLDKGAVIGFSAKT